MKIFIKNEMVFLFALFCSFSLIAQETEGIAFGGKVLNNEEALSYIAVIIKEIDMVSETDENGAFLFTGVPEGTYTLLIIADGFQDKEFSISVVEDILEQEFQIADAVDENIYQGEDIIVTAERFKNSESGKKTFSREDIEILPLQGDDPTTIISLDNGVINVEERGGASFANTTRGQIYSVGKEFSVYGGETGWNRYFYGHIQIPTNTHISNPNASIITRKAVETVDSYKGMPSGIYGPGLGGTVVLEPRRVKENILLLGISPTDPSMGFSYWITENLSLFISARYSIAKYTVVPFIRLWAKTMPDVNITIDEYTYADAIIDLRYKNAIHDINFLSIGFYDNNVANASINTPSQDSTTPGGTIEAEVVTLPIYGATGVSWDMLVGDAGVNKLATYVSVYNSSAHTLVDIEEGEDSKEKFGYTGYTNTVDVRVLDYYDWLLNESMVLSFGMELQYLNVFGKHEDVLEFKNKNLAVDLEDVTDTYRVQESIYRVYGFTEYAWNFDIVESVSTVGLTQIITDDGTSFERTFPSARLSTIFNFTEKWKLALVESISPAFMEGSKYIDRLITEEISSYDNRNSYTHPTYGIMAMPKLTWQITKKHTLFLEPFFGYYYNFAGMHSGLVINNEQDQKRGYLYITPTQGVNTGASVEWNWRNQFNLVTLSYTLGYAMYDTEAFGWLPPSNDYRHQVKTSYTFNKWKFMNIGVRGNLLYDVAFTPLRMTENTTDTGDALVEENGYPLSARSYIPVYELYVNINGLIIDKKRWDFKYRLQPGNLLSMFKISSDGIKDKSYVGATNADRDNRTFEYEFVPENIIQGIFLSFVVAIDLKKL